MRIGLDAHILGKGKGGVERVVHQMVRLLPELMPQSEFVVFTKKGYLAPFGPRPNVRYRPLPVDDPVVQRSVCHGSPAANGLTCSMCSVRRRHGCAHA
jgi:hypothetical protein